MERGERGAISLSPEWGFYIFMCILATYLLFTRRFNVAYANLRYEVINVGFNARNKMDALDLILNALKSHEKTLDGLIERFEQALRDLETDRENEKERMRLLKRLYGEF